MKVLAHLDPVVLERTLLDELAESSPSSAAVVIVPTRRLAGHLEQRLLERRPAWLGLDVLHFHSLALRILAETGIPPPQILSPNLIEAILRGVLRRHRQNRWSRYVRERPGALSSLASSLRDLSEAGLSPDTIERTRGDRDGQDLAPLYRGFREELDRLRAAGWVDDAGLIEAALPHAESFAARRQGIWLHGAYEWIGRHTQLVRALDRRCEVRVLFPFEAGAPVSRYAERFLKRHLRDGGGEEVAVDAIASADERLPLAALYDEGARPVIAEHPRIVYRTAQGAAAEIKGAVRAALAAVGGGCPPHEIVIAARSLTPYKAALDEVFEQEGLPWTGSLTQPLRNHPAIHDFALLIAVLDENFPRRGTAELLRSPRIRWDRFAGGGATPRGEYADGWSRAAGVVGGLDEWAELLVEWAGQTPGRAERSGDQLQRATERAAERSEEAKRITAALRRVHEHVRPDEARTWSGHSDRLTELIATAFCTEDEVWDDVAVLLSEMRSLETIVGETGVVSFGDMRRWLETAIDRTERMPHRRDNGGIRVLDMMQLRGITCRFLFLVGMNSGVLPRPPRPDPVLPDELRETLGGTDTPLPVKKDGLEEERLLLSLALGAATERIEISWQRADETGRSRTPSLALRETARLSYGAPELAVCLRDAVRHPSHPTHALEWLQHTTGMLSTREERLLTTLKSVGQPRALDEWYPDMTPGLNLLRATESFEFHDRGFDGRIGATELTQHPLSVSALETLARCPLRFFFQRVLRVREFDEEATPFELTPREIGQQTHDLLERTYAMLRAEGLFDQPLAERVRRAKEILDEVWADTWRAIAKRLSRRAPALWAAQETRWKAAIAGFVTEDLERIEANAWGAPEIEQTIDRELSFGADRSLHLIGRVDRSFGGGAQRVIGDYKTGGVAKLTDETRMLKAETLQVPLYWMLAEAKARVEVLGVGPRHDPAEIAAEDRILAFNGLEGKLLDGFRETMRVLTDLIADGVFPLNDTIGCDYCPYELSCRHKHPPTKEREEHAADRADFSDLGKKNKSKKPTLEEVRAGK